MSTVSRWALYAAAFFLGFAAVLSQDTCDRASPDDDVYAYATIVLDTAWAEIRKEVSD